MFDISHRKRDMINSVELHEQRECLLCRRHGVAGPDDSMSADGTLETFQGDLPNVLK